MRKVPGHQNSMMKQEHVDCNGASPLADLKAHHKSLNQCCGREEANVVRQAGSLVSVPGTSWVEGSGPTASNRVCFNELGQMNDINVGHGSKDCSPDLMVSEDQSEHLTPLYPYSNRLLDSCFYFICCHRVPPSDLSKHLNGKTCNLNSGNTVDKPQKGALTC